MNLNPTKLIVLVSQLSIAEQKGLSLWLKSPIHNNAPKATAIRSTFTQNSLRKKKPSNYREF